MGTNEFKILGVRIDNISARKTECLIEETLENNFAGKFVVTLNPEIVLKAHWDKKYCEILNSSGLNLCDGFGLRFAAWLEGRKIKARYTGVKLVDFALKLAKEKNLKVLIVMPKKSLSAPKEIERSIEEKYGLNAQAKYWDGQSLFESEEANSADIVLVNFGAPSQEVFISENKDKFSRAKILAGVGGAFDYLTGKMKRAPTWMQKSGLEWLWRLVQEPKRVKRIITAVLVFPAMAIIMLRKK
jgi:N-acetylglucosaminyldiphosphoundecaprenol N-acetyl-beta-D-mannosaminyltransferase